jgi:hypothetical protein
MKIASFDVILSASEGSPRGRGASPFEAILNADVTDGHKYLLVLCRRRIGVDVNDGTRTAHRLVHSGGSTW